MQENKLWCCLYARGIAHLRYIFFYFGLAIKKKRQHGISIHKQSDIVRENIFLISADIVVHDHKIWIISAYSPAEKSVVSEKVKFYTDLSNLCILMKTVY